MKTVLSLFMALAFLATMFPAAQKVEAVLGESGSSIDSDRKTLKGQLLGTRSGNGYTVHEIGSAAVTLQEYVSPSGAVFALVWKGLARPDLTHLLGSYAGEYQETLRHTAPQKGIRQLRIKTRNIVVEQWGHMRDLHGRAYVPALIPEGMSVDEIK